MKVKSDFVTNSSSVNFIIGKYNDSKILKAKIEIEIDLLDYADKCVTTMDELAKYFSDELYQHEIDNNEEYKKCKEVIEKGGEVIFIDASDGGYGGGGTETHLCHHGINDLKFDKGIVVIKGEGGY